MLLQPSEDQEFFRDTTTKFLADKAPISTIRSLRDDPVGFDRDYWRQGAELGWTSMLVAEDDGGGSVSGEGIVDLSLIAHEFGIAAAPGPLASVAVTAGALSAAGGHGDLVAELLAGTAIATWAFGEGPPHHGLGTVETTIRRDGDDVIVDGVKRPVESANAASHVLVTGRSEGGLTQVVVPTDADGVTVTPMTAVDLTRRFSVVRFDSVRLPADALVGAFAGAQPAVRQQLHHALVVDNAESVGAMQFGFDMTVEWAFDRYSFGRPLASYQAIKHRFADMTTWLHGSHAIGDEAAAAVAVDAPDATKLVSAAKAFIGEYGSELLQECVQFHGGIGVTYEHDLHLFLRRHTLNRSLHGTPAEHRRRIAANVIEGDER